MNKQIFELDDYLDTYIIKNGIPDLYNNVITIVGSSSKNVEDDEDDDCIKHDLEEDLCTTNVSLTIIKRYQAIVKSLKKKYNYQCQLCGYSFHMDNGNDYCEAHHIKELSKGGSQNPNNVLILCPNHHRQFHYACRKIKILFTNGGRIIEIDDHKYLIPTSPD